MLMNVIKVPLSAGITGFESPANDYKLSSISLDELLIRNPNSTWIGKASGDSMQDVGIFDGDLLIVDRQAQTLHNSVIVANLNGEFVCKILDKERRLLLSANEKYQPVPITEHDHFTLEGVVIHSVRLHSPCMLGE